MERDLMVDVDRQRPIEVENQLYLARFVGERMQWGLGNIEAPDFTEVQKENIAQNVIESMVKVDETQLAYSGCTDGRIRVRLADGSAAPVREKLVGADMVTAFHMAEVLGKGFYGGVYDALLEDRVMFVANFLLDRGILPSTHGPSCGAAAGYPVIVENAIKLSENPDFTTRQGLILPQYDKSIQEKNVDGYRSRLTSGMYDGWSEDLIRDAVLETAGQKGVKELLDDGKGVHGHTEIVIARIKPRGFTVGATMFAARMEGAELFTVNDARQEFLAHLMTEGDQGQTVVALNGSEDLQDAGHATLSRNLETLIVEAKAA